MTQTVKVFDWDGDKMHGVHVVLRRDPFFPPCKTDDEIDLNVKQLKDDLDAVAKGMKKALIKFKTEPLFET